MVRKMDVKERFFRAVLPMAAAVAVVGLLLLAEPDMGAFMVIAVIAMGILFLGGVNARMFFLIAAVMTVAFVLMIALSDWRRERIFAYLDPWSEKYALGKGYQLSHSLIAIGRGEIFGVGLGGSVEKLHWLPEAHITRTSARATTPRSQRSIRPSHADYTYDAKYGFRDWRGGGRTSARETAGRVAAGADRAEAAARAVRRRDRRLGVEGADRSSPSATPRR